MGKALLMLGFYIAIFLNWIFNVLIPIGEKVLIHIQNHSNLNTPLDLVYCAKQILWIILYGILCSVLAWIISLLLVFRK